MKGSKYLSELINLEGLCINALNIIKAPTGSGKTYFALNELPKHCFNTTYNAVYLIDTINGKEQILKNYNARPATYRWIQDMSEDGLWFCDNKQVVIMTYAKFGFILSKQLEFYNRFKYIVCDELHKLIDFSHYQKSINLHGLAKEGIESAIRNNSTIVLALTATPQKVYNYFNGEKYQVPINSEELRHYETNRIEYFSDLFRLIKELDQTKTGLCYTGRIHNMNEASATAVSAGLKPLAFWSINNEDHLMSAEQLRVRSIVLNEYSIPPEYNFLIINSSSETSIKIKSPVDYVIVNNSNKDIQTQVRGRVNNDLDVLYLPSDSAPVIEVPDGFLGRKLFTEDKEQLCKELGLHNKNGRLYKWRGIKDKLLSQGYEIKDGRLANYRYSIINPKE